MEIQSRDFFFFFPGKWQEEVDHFRTIPKNSSAAYFSLIFVNIQNMLISLAMQITEY